MEASCVEALYNIALACEKLKERDQALDYLFKFQAIVGLYPKALYKIGQQYEAAGDVNQSMEWSVKEKQHCVAKFISPTHLSRAP